MIAYIYDCDVIPLTLSLRGPAEMCHVALPCIVADPVCAITCNKNIDTEYIIIVIIRGYNNYEVLLVWV